MVASELLRHYLFFTDLTEAQLKSIAGLAEEVHCQAGEALFHEGHAADALYLLMDGRVALYHNVLDEDEATVRTAEAVHLLMEDGADVPMLEGQSDVFKEYPVGDVRPSEIVGISVLIPPYRLTATARTTCPSRLLKIDAVGLRQLCQEDPEMGLGLMSATARTALERLHAARQQLATRG